MRKYFEELEENTLSPLAIKSIYSKGKVHNEPASFNRTCFQRDRDRIVHSKSFRKLKDKTQVFVATITDHYRSRLTHTIEVSQISRHLARLLRLNEDLAECIALAHDLGHSPFGHAGESVLNSLLANEKGFEHNLHSIRIVEEIEQKYPKFPGLNLSYEVIEGLKKHNTPWDKPNQPNAFVSLEAQIANISDEIAYNNHDIDDGITSGILQLPELLQNLSLFKEANKVISKQYSSLEHHERAHLLNSHIISQQVINVFEQSMKKIKELNINSISEIQNIKTPIIYFDNSMTEQNNELRHYLFKYFYNSPQITKHNNLSKTILKNIFNYLLKRVEFIPNTFITFIQNKKYSAKQALGYYIASMTDTYTIKFCINNHLIPKEELDIFKPLLTS